MNPSIIYQDNDIVVVNKPAGIAVHKGVAEKGETLADWLAEKFPEMKKVGGRAGVAVGDCPSLGQRYFRRFNCGTEIKKLLSF